MYGGSESNCLIVQKRVIFIVYMPEIQNFIVFEKVTISKMQLYKSLNIFTKKSLHKKTGSRIFTKESKLANFKSTCIHCTI